MKIINFQSENFKKIKVVEISPKENLIEITGKNAQGKTSVLDAIYVALAGLKASPSKPIRNGETTARIKLDLGEMIVTRTFGYSKEGAKVTSTITVQSADGAKYPSPQSILDKLLGELSFDPLAFSRMAPRDQFEVMKKFVPGVDFALIEAQNDADYQKRRELNRKAKGFRDMYESIPTVPDNIPKEPLDEKDLIDTLQKASKHNADIETRKANRARVADEIKALNMEIEEKTARRNALKQKLDGAKPLPEPVEISLIRGDLDNAKQINELVERRKVKAEHLRNSEEIEAEANALTAQMEKRNEEKQKAIEAAKLPVDNVSFGDGEILLDGVPFEQASDAQQLRASIAIAMALNPQLKVIRVRDGSLLDEDSMKLLAELANEKDYQVWIERVDSSGKVGFVLEDGHLKGAKHVIKNDTKLAEEETGEGREGVRGVPERVEEGPGSGEHAAKNSGAGEDFEDSPL